MARLLPENSRLRLAWDALIALIALVTTIRLPLAWLQARLDHQPLSGWWTLFSLLGLLDIGLNFITSFERDGVVVSSPRAIRRAYLRGMAPWDLLANLPTLITALSGMASSTIALLPLLRCVRLLFLSHRWEALNLIDLRVLRISRYGFSILVITHWMACLWLAVGLAEISNRSWIATAGWSQRPLGFLYEMSLFWTITLVTVGYGEIFPHTVLEIRTAMLMMASSLLIYTFAIANMLNLLKELDGGRSEYYEHQSMLARFLTFNGVSSNTINRVRRFNDFQWARTRGWDTRQLFEDLPKELRSEITLEMMHDTLQGVPLLAEAPPTLQKRLLEVLEPVTFPPGTIVLEKDEPGESIVFVTRGSVRIETATPLPEDVRRVDAGDYVGDLSFFLHEPRNCRVVAETYVVAFILSRPIYETLRRQQPNLYELLCEIAADQSKRNQALLLAGVLA